MADPGIILAILSAVFNGSFVAFAKLRSVAACELHPVLFNFYVTLGVFLSCFVAAPFFPLVGARFELDALGGLVFSQRVLLALTQAGMSREDAYAAVQRNAMESWSEGKSFLELLKADGDVSSLVDDATLEDMFDLGYHTKNVDTIFKRVFG